MNTFLSSAQEALKDEYFAYAREHVLPAAAALEHGTIDLKRFLQAIGQAGYLGLTVPIEYGGSGCPFINLILFVEAVSQFDPGLGLILAGHTQVIELIKSRGTVSQKSRYLPLLASGESIGALAINEPDAGTDVQAVKTECIADGDKVALKGGKSWVVNADIASLFAVFAKRGDLFAWCLVERPSDAKVKVGEPRSKLGLRSAPTADVSFDLSDLTPGSLLAPSGGSQDETALAEDTGKTIVAAMALGLVERALAQSVEHSSSRHQFGQPISQFQAIQWKLADMSTDLSAARLLTYRAAWSKDESSQEFTRLAAMTKLFAARVARIHSGEYVQILGALGVSEDQPAEKFYRDAKVMEIAEGTSECQKLVLVKELGV